MNSTRFAWKAAVVAGALIAGQALAGGTKYQSNVVDLGVSNTTAFHLLKPGKVAFKSSIAAGGGGLVTQLVLSNVDCPTDAQGNDASITGKCGPKLDPIVDHVMELGISFAGLDLPGVAGLKYNLKQGKAAFENTGKNSTPGSALGATVTLVFNQPLGIGFIRLRTPGTDPSVCDTTPLLPGNHCLNGTPYAIAGVVVGSDPLLVCSVDTDCSRTATCVGGICTTETCTVDADCNNGGGVGGTGQCGSDGKCCDPALDATCAGQVP